MRDNKVKGLPAASAASCGNRMRAVARDCDEPTRPLALAFPPRCRCHHMVAGASSSSHMPVDVDVEVEHGLERTIVAERRELKAVGAWQQKIAASMWYTQSVRDGSRCHDVVTHQQTDGALSSPYGPKMIALRLQRGTVAFSDNLTPSIMHVIGERFVIAKHLGPVETIAA